MAGQIRYEAYVEDVIYGCRLCRAVLEEPIGSRARRSIADFPLRYFGDFVLMPALGALVPGNTILVSREHLPSAAHLNTQQAAQFEEALNQAHEFQNIAFGPSMAFEHGLPLLEHHATTCISHLHIQFLPCIDGFSRARDLADEFVASSYKEIRFRYGARRHYLWARFSQESEYAMEQDAIVSQYFREFYAERLGLKEWDWRLCPMFENIQRTIELAGRL